MESSKIGMVSIANVLTLGPLPAAVPRAQGNANGELREGQRRRPGVAMAMGLRFRSRFGLLAEGAPRGVRKRGLSKGTGVRAPRGSGERAWILPVGWCEPCADDIQNREVSENS